ncbi:hypothetical protein PTTG_27573 [Puccinia triticina 1-1 BBBD Race 1]|uniref:Uncharacterized protein n=2 Tax=Puccinia triticina TaxID=208348 RepID=A0A180GIN1_PUCT1|nr:uncharacterized protein PtA15_2A858 [Puccinia triticina]OAV92627.1 hypothetical protein PTTG_27573 [Puccinia triticina 1-1 BBBD Race 1]WAQ82541.1 hypothetical protein PtA15_2A858 [Puccinia triticina]
MKTFLVLMVVLIVSGPDFARSLPGVPRLPRPSITSGKCGECWCSYVNGRQVGSPTCPPSIRPAHPARQKLA